jgi:hypothetical protein
MFSNEVQTLCTLLSVTKSLVTETIILFFVDFATVFFSNGKDRNFTFALLFCEFIFTQCLRSL